jgi:basic amino acid/polyamine antiporter, APA family
MSHHGAMPPVLKRRLGLPLLVLYGVGITIGAGIYVLIGAVAGHAGRYAPWSFLLAAGVMAFTVGSYAELATRFPVSAGEAAYVRHAFGSRALSRTVGLLTILVGLIASSTVAIGAAGYISQFISLPEWALVAGVLLLLGAVAAWGILESVLVASVFTLIEVAGLLVIIILGAKSGFTLTEGISSPPLHGPTLAAIGYASLLAFFAFIGFEDLANVVEEAKMPHRDIPLAMAITLLIATALYWGVATVAVSVTPPEQLAASKAPLKDVFQALTTASPAAISLIAISATLNTILAQISMAARVIYGMARQDSNPYLGHRFHCRDGCGNCAPSSVRASGRKHVCGNPAHFRAGQSLAVMAASHKSGAARATRPRADLGARDRSCHLYRNGFGNTRGLRLRHVRRSAEPRSDIIGARFQISR